MTSQSVVSWGTSICISLAFICGLAMKTSTDTATCTLNGNETRVGKDRLFKNLNESCLLTNGTFEEVWQANLSLTRKNGTLEYRLSNKNNKKQSSKLDLDLNPITNLMDFKKVHLLTCWNFGKTCTVVGKLRFGQYINDHNLTTVFEYFQKSSSKQKCQCYVCHCDKCKDNFCPKFTCNCEFNNQSSRPTGMPVLPSSERSTSKTLMTTSTSHPTTSEARTEITSTDIPVILEPTTITTQPTSAETVSRMSTETTGNPASSVPQGSVSAARQSDGESAPTIAAVCGLSALVVIVSGVTVFVCLRRRRWNKKQSNCSDTCLTNPSYGELKVNGSSTGHDNRGFYGSGSDVPNYDTADDQKSTKTCEQPYSYAKIGVQYEFQEMVSEVNLNRSLESSDYYARAKTVSGNIAEESFPINSTNIPGRNFNVETGCQLPPIRNNANNNYFVLDKDASERTEALQTTKPSCSLEDGNYCLVEESENGQPNENSETENIDMNGIQGENYFVLEHDNFSEENSPKNFVYALAQLQTEDGNGCNRKDEQNQRKPNQDIDPYDHVRVGHVQTNGYDDGVYDELRKQNVRYEPDGIDNDYDHCPVTGHH